MEEIQEKNDYYDDNIHKEESDDDELGASSDHLKSSNSSYDSDSEEVLISFLTFLKQY